MTVSSELILSAAYAAPTGSSKDSASTGKAGTQAPDEAASENNTVSFKDLLGQATNKQSSTDKKTSGNQISNPSETISDLENTEETINSVVTKNPETFPETFSELSQYIMSAETALNTNNAVLDENTIVGPNPQATADTQNTQSTVTQPEQGNSETEMAAPPREGQQENKIAGTDSEEPASSKELPQQTASLNGKILEPEPQVSPPANNNQASPADNAQNKMNIGSPEAPQNKDASAPPEGKGISATSEGDEFPPDAPESRTKEAADQSDPKTVAQQKPTEGVSSAQDDATKAPNTDVSKDEGQPPLVANQQAIANTETEERQTVTPQQQVAAAVTHPALQREVENKKADKVSRTDTDAKISGQKLSDPKISDKGNSRTVANEKKSASPSQKAKEAVQNSGEDNNSASKAQGKQSAMSPLQMLQAKAPFLTELSQAMAGTEVKATGIGSPSLPPGLLVAQEVSPTTLQNNSITAPGQIKPPMLPVSPQMVTKQINMAILKQAGNNQQSFQISLKPAELGQVDIRMDFQTDGRMTATVIVENERTLTLLQKDQGSLEKALENAGFDAGGNNLNFSLKKNPQQQEQTDFASNNSDGGDGDGDEMSSLPGSIISQQQMKMTYSDNLLDINI